ncbi:ATP-binding protein [Gracilimonas sp.]|uniref:PAS domain-containing sensor histidine kinase n=1 Tax=Gracilimonas sp. TaxID=1974203 RepID=UPI002871385A|nr:PAS domain-containing sensor histidine kinase [Gracilimonas sp.]
MKEQDGTYTLTENSFQPKHFRTNYESSFYQLIKNSFDMLVMLDDTGTQFFVNESCKYILGYEPEELVGIDVIETMIHPDDRPKVKSAFMRVIRKKYHGGIQYRHWHKKGGWVYLEAVGNNLLDDPAIEAIVLNVRDITERKEAEEKLRSKQERLQELNAGKDKLLSIIAHDLRSPLSSIIGFSDLLSDVLQSGDTEQAKQFASIIHDSTLQINELLDNLLMWARNQSGRIDYSPESIVLNKVIEENIRLEKDSALQKSITISYSQSKLITVEADKNMLNTVLRNLISNAIKFTPNHGNIQIKAKVKGNEALVSVSDNGTGVPEHKIGKLFQIEHSKSTDGTNGEKGSGLGLLLCKDFVELHGGSIWAENNQGKGANFSFTLPLS